MFKKYSNSRDLFYSVIFILVLLLMNLFGFNVLVFNTQEVTNSLLQLFGVFFVFILTIITIMFMFDYRKSPILKKIKDADLFNQIFKRYFDSLVVISLSLIYLLISYLYFEKEITDMILNIFGLLIPFSYLTNFIILMIVIFSIIRIYRCLNLLNLVYKSIFNKEKK